MNRAQAYTLVRQTFTQAFDKSRFARFSRELLNHLDESKATPWNNTYVKNAFKPDVQRYERLGTYTSPGKEKLDVLVVYLTADSKLERARTAIRNFVADHLKTRDEKDAALVAFVSPSEASWRFSYIKMEYATVEKASGKIGVEERLTPARRFSYIVGEGESCHTAQTRFLDLLQDTEANPTLADIEEAFSVETVTKEFFTKYVELFDAIHTALDKLVAKDKTAREELSTAGVNTVDFAKKLMGQIVFLYFLQKKGWLGVRKGEDWGSGPRDFLRRLAKGEYGPYDNFFNDALEPLFYDELANDRGHAAWSKRFNCRIPFLNGGLFEAPGDYDWQKTDIILPNKLFTNKDFVEEGITGTGVLDVFDRYNFTVNEAEPLEKEVAIDPEMLGKVFENLIEDNRRKGLGAYYTPREIVHYMCQESLINYLDTALNTRQEALKPAKPKQSNLFGETEPEQTTLHTTVREEIVPRTDIETFVHLGEQISHYEAVATEYKVKMPKSIEQNARAIDEALAEITVCDPAVGSGAFPVGMMTEIVRARSALTNYFNDTHERSAYHFKRHAIQNCLYGVDIDAGAVEIAKLRLWLSLVVDEEDTKQIKPLPNLDYKIVAGNSLLGIPFKSQRVGEIEKLKQRFFDETDHAVKARLKAQVSKLLEQTFTSSKRSLGYDVNFDFHIYFSEVFQQKGGFDIVVANPPYIGEKGHKEIFREIKQGPLKEFYQGKMDIFYFFFHLAIKLGDTNSQVAFITTNYYPTASGARKLRRDFKQHTVIRRLVNFNELKIFESALGQHNMLTLLQKTTEQNIVAQTCVTKRVGVGTSDILQAILSWTDKETAYSDIPQRDLYEGEEYYIRMSGNKGMLDDPTTNVLGKIKTQGEELARICNINQGIISGADKTSQKHLKTYKLDAQLGDGIFILNKQEVANLTLVGTEREILKPWFKNSDIRRWWTADKHNEYLIFADKRLNNLENNRIKKHLLRFKDILDNSTDNSPYLHRPRDINFNGPKIVAPQRSPRNTFGYNQTPWYASADVYYITQKDKAIDLKYILGLLNSKLYFLWLYLKGKRKGEMLELYQKPLSEIPIKRINNAQQKPIIDLSEKIITMKKHNPDADTTALEREIDKLVYRLYGLTEEEIKVVEGNR